MKEVKMLFYKVRPSKENTGFKYVLIEVTTNENKVIYDWGFADWLGDKWDVIEAPEGFYANVVWWANTINPDALIKEPGKIIKL